jgi:acyl carrier protein
MSTKVIEKYNKAFIETFSLKRENLKKLKYNSIPKWDSVGHMSLVGKLEESFGITFEMDDIIDFSSYEFGKKILKKYKIIIK